MPDYFFISQMAEESAKIFFNFVKLSNLFTNFKIVFGHQHFLCVGFQLIFSRMFGLIDFFCHLFSEYSLKIFKILPLTMLLNLGGLGTCTMAKKCISKCNLKWQCHEIFYLYFVSKIEPIWTHDKQAKTVLLKIRFREDIFKFEVRKFQSKRLFKQLVYKKSVPVR